METFFIIVFFLFGTLFGSFFNVVGLRVPKKISFAKGRSFCPSCKRTLTMYELIPVVSFLIQRGKCRNCQTKISIIYPVTEIVTGFLFAFCYYKLGFTVELITALLLMSMLMILFVTDVKYMLIPNNVLLFFLPLFIIMRIINPLTPWHSSITGSVIGFVLLAVIIIVSKGGMGAGDMKLFGVLGIILGLANVLLTFFLASLFGALVGSILIWSKIIKRKQPIPFGPYIIVATIITYFYGDSIITVYMSLLS